MDRVAAAGPAPDDGPVEGEWELAGDTDRGTTRERNEDALVLAPELGLAVVCDGIGGNAAGEVASALAAASVRDRIAGAPRQLRPAISGARRAGDVLGGAVRHAGRHVWRESLARPGCAGMGTTLVAALLAPDRAVIAHVGDSRAYLLRDGMLRRLTRDHSMLELFTSAARRTPEEIAEFPLAHVITRALGGAPEVEPDLAEVETRPGDRLLLCSDGLHGAIPDERIERLLAAAPGPAAAAVALVAAANEAGGHDNVTVAIAALR